MVRSGYLELYNTTIANTNGGLFVMNLVHGAAAVVENSMFVHNQVAAVIRAYQSSSVQVSQSLFYSNDALSSMVANTKSFIALDESYLEQNQVVGGEILLYDASYASVNNSCLIMDPANDSFATIFVDTTSQLDHYNSFTGSIDSSTAITVPQSLSFTYATQSQSDATPEQKCPPQSGIFMETSYQACLRQSWISGTNATTTTTTNCQGTCTSWDTKMCPLLSIWNPQDKLLPFLRQEQADLGRSNLTESTWSTVSSSPGRATSVYASVLLVVAVVATGPWI